MRTTSINRKVQAAMVLAMVAGCGGDGPPADYTVLQPDAATLRAAFDAGEGKVRALFLASPT